MWLIIAGERRWRAANRAGLKTVDCYFQEQALSPTRVSRALALLKLPHEMRVRVDAGELSARAGYEFSKLPEPLLAKVVSVEQPVTVADAARVVRQRKGKEKPAERGTHQTFFADNGWKVIVRSPKKGTYHDIEQAIFIALEEVRLRIDNRVKL